MEIIIYTITTFILNHLLMTERGPKEYLVKLRKYLKGLHPEVKMAVDCYICLSGYTSMIVVALGVLGGEPPRKAPLYWLATWGATLLLYEIRDIPQLILFAKGKNGLS
jgi:hypothetical protein